MFRFTKCPDQTGGACERGSLRGGMSGMGLDGAKPRQKARNEQDTGKPQGFSGLWRGSDLLVYTWLAGCGVDSFKAVNMGKRNGQGALCIIETCRKPIPPERLKTRRVVKTCSQKCTRQRQDDLRRASSQRWHQRNRAPRRPAPLKRIILSPVVRDILEHGCRSSGGVLHVYPWHRFTGSVRVRVYQFLERYSLAERLTWETSGKTALVGLMTEAGREAATRGYLEVASGE